MNRNGFKSWLLRSPFHGMLSSGMMLITVTGRTTGKKYTTPVGYFHENGDLSLEWQRDGYSSESGDTKRNENGCHEQPF